MWHITNIINTHLTRPLRRETRPICLCYSSSFRHLRRLISIPQPSGGCLRWSETGADCMMAVPGIVFQDLGGAHSDWPFN